MIPTPDEVEKRKIKRTCGGPLKHGHCVRDDNGAPWQSPTYRVWICMKKRCFNPKTNVYHLYGGRGITICDRWMTFDNFLADMGEKPEKLTIERINNDGNYEPGNCKWATQLEQNLNTRTVRIISFNGIKDSVSGWARRIGMSAGALGHRIRAGWPIEIALTKAPIRRL